MGVPICEQSSSNTVCGGWLASLQWSMDVPEECCQVLEAITRASEYLVAGVVGPSGLRSLPPVCSTTRHPAICRSCSWCRRASHVAAGICSAGSGSIRAITSDGLSMLASTSSGSHVCAPAALAAPLSVLKVSIEPTSWCAPESVSSLNYECSIQRPSDICMTSI